MNQKLSQIGGVQREKATKCNVITTCMGSDIGQKVETKDIYIMYAS